MPVTKPVEDTDVRSRPGGLQHVARAEQRARQSRRTDAAAAERATPGVRPATPSVQLAIAKRSARNAKSG